MKRIVFVAGGYDACGWYRCHVPGLELKNRGHDVRLIVGRNLSECQDADIVIFQRAADPVIANDMRFLKSQGKLVVYEIDDDIWHIDPTNPFYSFWSKPANRESAIACIRQADKVTTSTDILGIALKRLNNETYVLPNCLPDADWQEVGRSEHSPLRLGWAGSHTHWKDLSLISGVVEQILDEFPEVELLVAGMESYPFKEHSRIKVLEPVKLELYPGLLGNFDVGLAPLTLDTFNRCKSDLKFLEYGALEIPAVLSSSPPYESVEHGKTGFLAKNTKDWLKYLRRLISEPELRRETGKAARLVSENRFISRQIWRWEDVYELANGRI